MVISRPELTRARNHIGVETAHKTKEKLCNGLCSASLPSEYHLQVNIFIEFRHKLNTVNHLNCLWSNIRGSNIGLAGSRMRDAGWGLNQGRIWDMRDLKGEMRDENRKTRPGYAPFRRRIGDRMGMGQIIISSSYQSHDLRHIKQYLFALKTSLIGAPV